MNKFDFRNKYIDIDEDESEHNIENITFDDEVEDDSSRQNKKANDKKTIIIISIICAVVLLSSLAVAGFFFYRSAEGPVIESVHIESDSFENPKEAKYGNIVTLSFSFKKKIANTPIVIINNQNVEVHESGEKFYAKYMVQNQGNEDKKITFSIVDYRNFIRKTGPPVINTTDDSYVVIKAFK